MLAPLTLRLAPLEFEAPPELDAPPEFEAPPELDAPPEFDAPPPLALAVDPSRAIADAEVAIISV